MIGIVKVVPENEYKQWLANLKVAEEGKDAEGLKIMTQNNCTGCHSLDGTKLVGPSFKNIFNSERITIVNGKEQKHIADSAYIIESTLYPDIKVVKGYQKGLMKTYKGIIKDEDLNKIVLYLKMSNDKKK
jgi:cytochrome c oxidase subunit 2